MSGNVRRFRGKASRLLRLYSLWHKTHRGDLQAKCLQLLGEITAAQPHFNLRREFQKAF